MTARVPAYGCRVRGDARHWRRRLEEAVRSHNARAADDAEKVAALPPPAPAADVGWWLGPAPRNGEALWRAYAATRPRAAATPGGEAARRLMRDQEGALADAAAALDLAPEDADAALREVLHALLGWKMGGAPPEAGEEAAPRLTEDGRRMARFLVKRVEVPRDMGMVPALALREVYQRA